MGLQELVGEGKRGGGGKRLNWIRGVLIETGEKGQTPGLGVHRCKHSFDTQTSSRGPGGGVSSAQAETIQTFPGER